MKKEINSIAEIKNPVEDTIYTNVDCGFYVTNDSLFTAVTRYIPMEKEASVVRFYGEAKIWGLNKIGWS